MPMSELNLQIRPAAEKDVSLLLAFVRALAEYEGLGDQVVATESSLRSALFRAQPHGEAVIADHQGESVGFGISFHTFSTILGRRGMHLEDLYVTPAWRGRGVGRALLAHMARVAVERSCGRLEWWVLAHNEPALRFYEHLGARRMEEFRVFRLTGEALHRLANCTS